MTIKITKDGKRKIQDIIFSQLPNKYKKGFEPLRISIISTMIVNMLESDKEYIEVI